MNAQLKLLIYIILVAGILYFVQIKYNIFEISFQGKKEISIQENPKVEILNEDGKSVLVDVEISDTPLLREQGLSGRSILGDYQGMLFIMDSDGLHSFWMKDMKISLDLIYINSKGYIVDIFKMQSPCLTKECPLIKPSSPSKYVLEVNGGFTDINKVRVGNQVIFDISSEE